MENRNKVIIVRITQKEEEMVKELRQQHSINISNLIREFIKEYYEKRTQKEKN